MINPARVQVDQAISERDLQDQVVSLARLLGYRVHHTRPARRQDGTWSTPLQGDPGFPDLVIVGHGLLVFVELKIQRGRMTPEQREWSRELARVGVGDGPCHEYGGSRVTVWAPLRPSGFPDLEALLHEHAAARRSAT